MAVIFTTLTVGVNVTKHFSDGQLFSISVNGEAKSCCEVPCDDCSDESDLYQVQADYIFSSSHLVSNVKSYDLFQLNTLEIDVITIDRVNSSNYFVSADISPPESKDYLSKTQSFLL
jgi:hypothetical protein